MSWQPYVDEHLLCDIDGQRLVAAAIFGHDGSVWAQSDTFPQVAQTTPTPYLSIFVFHARNVAVGRGRLPPPPISGTGGVTVKKTNLSIIIGIYEEPMTPGQCNMVVERLGDYLVEQGF
ncbi:hypothetical protein E2562_000645 [Oryza meyeriana var. granulata]|uniref:Profilin n=1 Tax=Oryza meyeriana var. granulata TaxID=110450 RepID=A0A6G1DT53_9ORYZ|nr:hypothetical protein E2562_000645 [Oryza meyeriana var. granulata]